MLDFPNIPACAVCQKYMVDYDWSNGTGSGEIQEWGPPENRQKHVRPAVCPPPCKSCPKKGPEHENEHVLSDKNWRTLEFYRAMKATCGRGLSKEAASDAIVQRNFALLDRMFAGAEQNRLADTVAVAVNRAMVAAFGGRK